MQESGDKVASSEQEIEKFVETKPYLVYNRRLRPFNVSIYSANWFVFWKRSLSLFRKLIIRLL